MPQGAAVNLFGENDANRTIGIRAFARLVGVSDGCIRKDMRAGRITAVVKDQRGNPQLLEEEALRQFQEAHPLIAVDGALSDTGRELQEAQTRRMLAIARREEMLVKELEGQLHYTDDVREVMNDFIAGCRARVQIIPGKLAAAIAGLQDPVEIQRLLTEETDAALLEMSDYEYEEGRRAGGRQGSHRRRAETS